MSAPDAGAVTGGFTPEEERLHEAGFAAIREGLAAGQDFAKACERVVADDPDLRRIIVDDFLKVTIAERHFQGGESTEQVAAALGISVERVEFTRGQRLPPPGGAGSRLLIPRRPVRRRPHWSTGIPAAIPAAAV